MDFDDYQNQIVGGANYPGIGNNLTYPVLGLNGESGEVAEKLKKIIRDNKGVITNNEKLEIAKELGDVLWYLTMCCNEIGYRLTDVAVMNLEKIADRKTRGTSSGIGDNR